MLALGNPITARLAALPALTGWAVRKGSPAVDRKPLPCVDVHFTRADSAPTRNTAAQIGPLWGVTLAVAQGDDAEEMLDAAFEAVIKALHNWAPGKVGGRGWEPLRCVGVQSDHPPDGVLAFELFFSTQALYEGQD